MFVVGCQSAESTSKDAIELASSGKYGEALEQVQKIQEKWPDSPEAKSVLSTQVAIQLMSDGIPKSTVGDVTATLSMASDNVKTMLGEWACENRALFASYVGCKDVDPTTKGPDLIRDFYLRHHLGSKNCDTIETLAPHCSATVKSELMDLRNGSLKQLAESLRAKEPGWKEEFVSSWSIAQKSLKDLADDCEMRAREVNRLMVRATGMSRDEAQTFFTLVSIGKWPGKTATTRSIELYQAEFAHAVRVIAGARKNRDWTPGCHESIDGFIEQMLLKCRAGDYSDTSWITEKVPENCPVTPL